jgi:protein TonB
VHIGGIVTAFIIGQKKYTYPQVQVYRVNLKNVQIGRVKEREVIGKRKKKIKKKSSKKKKVSKTTTPLYKNKIAVEGREFKYSYYLDIIVAKVSENWRNPYEGKRGKFSCVVHFIIEKDGTIVKLKLHKSSGDYYFDQSAKMAIKATRKLPPLPEEYHREFLGVYFEFEYIQ